jgi:hypothetical protein
LDSISSSGFGHTEFITTKESESLVDLKAIISRQVERFFSIPRVDLNLNWNKSVTNEENLIQYPSKQRVVHVGDFITSFAIFSKPLNSTSTRVTLQQGSTIIDKMELNLSSKLHSSRMLHCLVVAGRLRELEDKISSFGDLSNSTGKYFNLI